MSNKILYLIVSLIVALGILITLFILSNYFGKVATFEPVQLKLWGMFRESGKKVTVTGYTPEGKESVFKYDDSAKVFYSYYGFLGRIGIRLPASVFDSIDSLILTSGREKFVYDRVSLDTAWIKSNLKGNIITMKSPLSLKTKETKVRILLSTRYWKFTRDVFFVVIGIMLLIILVKFIRFIIKK